MQGRNLEDAQRRDAQGILFGPAFDEACGASPEMARIVRDRPEPDMGVEQEGARQALLISHSASMGSKGRSYFRTVPFIDPTTFRGFGSTYGTSFATGLPCLVTTYSTPVSRTRSISSRQVALNSAAAT